MILLIILVILENDRLHNLIGTYVDIMRASKASENYNEQKEKKLLSKIELLGIHRFIFHFRTECQDFHLQFLSKVEFFDLFF